MLLSADLRTSEELKANGGAGYSSVIAIFLPKLRVRRRAGGHDPQDPRRQPTPVPRVRAEERVRRRLCDREPDTSSCLVRRVADPRQGAVWAPVLTLAGRDRSIHRVRPTAVAACSPRGSPAALHYGRSIEGSPRLEHGVAQSRRACRQCRRTSNQTPAARYWCCFAQDRFDSSMRSLA